MTHATFFSGIEGFALAAQWAGWTNVFNCEIDPFCRQVLKYYFPNSIQYGDIRTTDFTPWRGEIDVLSGGFPCQPFSLAGKRKGTDDYRHLWPEMLRGISEIRPTWVCGENVGGIVSMVQPGDEVEVETQTSLFGEDYTETMERQRFIIETICRDFEQIGYAVQPILIPACGVGAPHQRDRVWFIAEDTECVRRNCRKSEEESGSGGFGQFGAGNNVRVCGAAGITPDYTNAKVETMQEGQNGVLSVGVIADAQRLGGQEVHDEIQPREPDGARADGEGCEWNVADAENKRFPKRDAEPVRNRAHTTTQRYSRIPGWANFPTQPPIRGRDDGLSEWLDSEAVFAGVPERERKREKMTTRWQTESIKCYGNAIVPQVAYQIFEAINDYEKLSQ